MSSRAREAMPFGRPVGLPDFPGVNGRPMVRGVSALLAAAGTMGVRLARSLVGCEAGGLFGGEVVLRDGAVVGEVDVLG